MATPTRYAQRTIPQISLANFDSRISEITTQLASAAENVGFFSVVDHGITLPEIEKMFATSEAFFALPEESKRTVPWNPQNVGYEKMLQVRPSNGGQPDGKESYQLQFGENMEGLWIGDEAVPGFQEDSLEFMHKVQGVSEKLMRCLALALGFPEDFFVKWHDASKPDCQSTLRLLHYFATPEVNDGKVYHRAGAHADWGFLTLLFQRAGQSGLEICPGRESSTDFAMGDVWTRVELGASDIICNIGDLLMSWSDDRFKSTFHRVKAPCEPEDYYGERYSIAFFNQPRKDAVIQGPLKKYPAVTGAEFNANAMKRYYSAAQEALQAKKGDASQEVAAPAQVEAAA